MSLAGVADTTCWVIEVGLNGALTRCYKSMFFFFVEGECKLVFDCSGPGRGASHTSLYQIVSTCAF